MKNLVYSTLGMLLASMVLIILVVVLVLTYEPQNEINNNATLVYAEFGEADYYRGNIQGFELFMTNCKSCHDYRLKNKLIGPPLEGVTTRRDSIWIRKFIHNNVQMRQSGDKEANDIYTKYENTEMPVFEELSESELTHLFLFLKGNTVK